MLVYTLLSRNTHTHTHTHTHAPKRLFPDPRGQNRRAKLLVEQEGVGVRGWHVPSVQLFFPDPSL